MKKLLLIGAAVLFATSAVAQEREYDLRVTATEVNLIGKALGKLSFDEVAPIIDKLRNQVAIQNQPSKPVEQSAPAPAAEKKE